MLSSMRRFFRRKPRHVQNNEDAAASQKTANKPDLTQESLPFGIKTLYSSEASIVDIVFIHGLTGNRDETWSAPEQSPWPGDLLPKVLPNVNVLTFGYSAKVVDVSGVVSRNNVFNHAMNLVTSLATHRDDDDTQERPIIFVCHSLGGLVCQDALFQAKQRPEAHLKQIYTSTYGIVFMGTPHHGSGLAVWGEMLARRIGLIKQTNSHIVKVLTRDSEVLERIQDGFLGLVHSRDQEGLGKIEIVCFYEELPVPGLGVVVPRHSAAMPPFVPISIPYNHMDMTKFASESDQGFKAVVGELRRWVRNIAKAAEPPEKVLPSPQPLTVAERDFLASIGPRRYRHVEERVQGTCKWTTDTTQYHSWLYASHSSVLWVTGAAGTGKTTLANFLVEHLEQQYAIQGDSFSEHVICSFFCSREIEGHHDISSLLQDLILQLIQPRRELIRLMSEEYGTGKQEQSLSLEKIWRMFESVLKMLPCRCLFIIIDALDECDVDWRKELFERLARIVSNITNTSLSSRKSVKIIFSGQPQTRVCWNFESQSINHHEIDLDDSSTGISQDLQLLVETRVTQLVTGGFCTPQVGVLLQAKLKSMAGSSFLWLDLKLKLIQQGIRFRLEEVMLILEDTPDNEQLPYAKYLPVVPHRDQPILRDYLQILIACSRPLTFAEIDILRVAADQNSRLVSEAGTTNEKAIRTSIQRALGPLIKFPCGTAQFSHSTAREFFLLLSQYPQHPLYQSHGIDLCKAHLRSAKACMSYLLNPSVRSNLFDVDYERPNSASTNMGSSISDRNPLDGNNDDGSNDDMGLSFLDIGEVQFLKDPDSLEREACPEISRRWRAFDYAAMNWTYHLQRARTMLDSDSMEMGLRLISGDMGRSSDWYKYRRHQSTLQMPPLGKINAIILAAMFDLPQLLATKLKEFSDQSSTQWLSSALFWAASRNCEDTVRILLESGVLSKISQTGQAPLAAAAQGGFEGICNLLLAAEVIDPNQTNSQGKSALMVAAEANHVQILRQILRHEAIIVDQVDADGRTAFTAAARSGSLECVQALRTDGRADVDKADGKGQTPLLHASHAGHLPIVCELLRMVDVAIDTKDNSGRNAISLASREGHLDVVRQLFRRGVSPASKDIHGRNSISRAANSQKATAAVHGKECVLEYLIRKAPDTCNVPDGNGWVPLLWAVDTPGYLKSVELLLRLPSINLDRRSDDGMCALHWAAGSEMTDIVRCFLQRPDVNVNVTSSDGSTPLFSAARSGRVNIVKLLLQHPAIDRLHIDHKGRRAVDVARLNNHLDIVDLLEISDTSQDVTS